MGFLPVGLSQTAPSPESRLDWEESNCLLCGHSQTCPLIEAPDLTTGGSGLWFAVVQCQRCGLCFTNPRPTPSCMDRFYPKEYAPHFTRLSRPRLCLARRVRQTLRLRETERKSIPLKGKGRLLDFGCGGGSYLVRMREQGWHVTGLDLSTAAVRRVREDLGLPAFEGSLPCPALQDRSFDVVTMWQVLEHVHNPMEALRDAHRLLVPGGRLVVTVPNIDSLSFRLFGAWWYSLDLPRHLTHFTPSTLYQMIDRAGFRVGPIRMVRHSSWLRASAASSIRRQNGRTLHRWLQTKWGSRFMTWYGFLSQRSDCILVNAER
jgi:2-polyprenyl-3-methyl-5-hydroxy-6-metoxy-1,4-benzoquinol methylase